MGAPELVQVHERVGLQGAYENEERLSAPEAWSWLGEGMRDWRAPGAGGVPVTWISRNRPPRCAILPCGFLVQLRFASILIGPDGEVRDIFQNSDLRAIGGDERHVLLVPADTPAAFVRDVFGRKRAPAARSSTYTACESRQKTRMVKSCASRVQPKGGASW